MTDFPGYVNLIADGRVHGRDTDVQRTLFDDGMVRQERRYGSALRTREVTAWVKGSSYTRWRDWVADHAHRWFSWRDLDGTVQRGRVRDGAAGIRETASVRGGVLSWDLAFTIEGP